MTSIAELTLTLGTANLGPGTSSSVLFTHNTAESVKAILDCWYNLGGRRLDTARYYGISPEFGPGGSERRLGEYKENAKFIVDTKVRPVRDTSPVNEPVRF